MGRDARIFIPRSQGPRLGRYTVSSPCAPLRRKASHRSGLDTQLLYGQFFDVFRQDKNWVWGQSVSPVSGSRQKGYVGFVPLRDLTQAAIRPNHIVEVLRAPLFSKADIKSPIKNLLPLGSLTKSVKTEGLFKQLHTGEYIHENHIRRRKAGLNVSDFVTIAERHYGLPYIWGGVSSDGLDCSGLVLSSLRAVGEDAPRDTDMQQDALGIDLPLKQSGLKRGDLIFWRGHVGIMTSPKMMIHANAFHMRVETEPLRVAASRILSGGGGPITAIKRL